MWQPVTVTMILAAVAAAHDEKLSIVLYANGHCASCMYMNSVLNIGAYCAVVYDRCRCGGVLSLPLC